MPLVVPMQILANFFWIDIEKWIFKLISTNVIILGVTFKQNINFKIQMLVGNSFISFLNSNSEKNPTLVRVLSG